MTISKLSRPEAKYLFDECSGHYIPQRFAREMNREYVNGVTQEQWDILENGPDNEFYNDVWCEVLNNAKSKDPMTGVIYTFYQQDGVWALPEGIEINDNGEFFWPEDEQDESND